MFKSERLTIYFAFFINILGLVGIIASICTKNQNFLFKSVIFFIVFTGYTIGILLKYKKKIKFNFRQKLKLYMIGLIAVTGNVLFVFVYVHNLILQLVFNLVLLVIYLITIIKFQQGNKEDRE